MFCFCEALNSPAGHRAVTPLANGEEETEKKTETKHRRRERSHEISRDWRKSQKIYTLYHAATEVFSPTS